MAPTHNQILGACGEGHALAHYQRLGFHLVERNHRTRRGEIDLVVADRSTLVFVEVKARRGGGLDPLHSFRHSKRTRLRALAVAWLREHPGPPHAANVRIDLVTVVLDRRGDLIALEQFEDVA